MMDDAIGRINFGYSIKNLCEFVQIRYAVVVLYYIVNNLLRGSYRRNGDIESLWCYWASIAQ